VFRKLCSSLGTSETHIMIKVSLVKAWLRQPQGVTARRADRSEAARVFAIALRQLALRSTTPNRQDAGGPIRSKMTPKRTSGETATSANISR
jgi:hypothetical protein